MLLRGDNTQKVINFYININIILNILLIFLIILLIIVLIIYIMFKKYDNNIKEDTYNTLIDIIDKYNKNIIKTDNFTQTDNFTKIDSFTQT